MILVIKKQKSANFLFLIKSFLLKIQSWDKMCSFYIKYKGVQKKKLKILLKNLMWKLQRIAKAVCWNEWKRIIVLDSTKCRSQDIDKHNAFNIVIKTSILGLWLSDLLIIRVPGELGRLCQASASLRRSSSHCPG